MLLATNKKALHQGNSTIANTQHEEQSEEQADTTVSAESVATTLSSEEETANATARETSEVTREQLALGKKLLNWRTLLPLAIVIAALIFAIAKANINPQKIWVTIQHANPFFLVAAFVIYYLSFGLRSLRWRLLLENVGYTKENGIHLPNFWQLTRIVYISFFANTVVPAKLGDLYRAYLLHQQIEVSTTRSFGTVLAERLLDLFILLLLFIPAFLISSLHQSMPTEIVLGMKLLLGAVVICGIALFVLRMQREAIAKLVPIRFREHYYHFQEGTLGSFRRLPGLIGLTVGVWACEALRFFFIALALKLIGGNFLHIFSASMFIGLGEALLTVIPTTGGGVGLVEGGMAGMIALFNHSKDVINQAAAAIVIDRVISFFSILIIGAIIFALTFGHKGRKKAK
ncbi:TIGR00374 family protein [Ktedonobacteria bacterium brp13]|nr:TIGR00374 family protein [Ktedonobacteria bacterium brp13]